MTYITNPHYSIQSTTNTTTTPLSGGATFTGTSELNNHPAIFIDIRTDAECTVYTQFSVDGTNWTNFPVNGYSLNATNNYTAVDTATKSARYYRLQIVNGAAAQTFLRAYSYFGVYDQLNAPLNQSYNLSSGSRLVRPSWTWLDVARGLAGGITSVKKFGRNAAVGTSFVPVCIDGLYQTPQPGSATALRIKAGGNANDTAAGTGARSVRVTGTDENFELATEVITTAGASASSATTTTFTRLFLIDVETSGTYATLTAGSHAGKIVIENSAGGTDWGAMDAAGFAKSGSEIGAYTIPSGYTGFIKLRDLSIDSGKTVDAIFFSRPNCDQTAAPYSAMRARSVITGVAGGSIEAFGATDVPFGPFVGPTDVGFMAKVASGTASVSVEFEIILVEN